MARAATRALFLVGVLASCGGRDGTADGGRPAEAALPTESAAMALAPATLRAAAEAGARRARLAEGTVDGVRLARSAAALFRVRALRERDARRLEDARRLLSAASRRSDLPGACDAALDRAKLEALDAADLRAGWIAAHRVEARFGRVDGAGDCVAEARRMARLLESARPSDAEVVAIDASDDDDDDVTPAAADPGRIAEGGLSDPQIEAWAAAHAGSGVAPRLVGVDVPGGLPSGPRATHARIVLRFSAPASFARSELARDGPVPRRLVLDFRGAQAAPDVPPVARVGAGGVARVRVAQTDPRTLRVVLDVEESTRTQIFFLAAPFRVVVDADRGATHAGPAVGPQPLRLLVLDPGHGGDDHGAPGQGGLRESRVALDLAKRVKALLAQRLPDVGVVLTRDRDVFVSLEQRAAIANAAGADAFVSIHLNASPTPAEVGGVGTFVLDTTDDHATLALAARENGTSEADLGDLARLLASVERADQAGGSRALADAVQASTLAAGRRELPSLGNRGVQPATFYVLVGTEMPAVLVEASFILRAPEAPLLARESYRQRLAEGIADGIVAYAHR